jgi:hypothetical protein
MALALFIFGIFAFTIQRNEVQPQKVAKPTESAKELLETQIEKCAEEAQNIQDQLLISNKFPQNKCSLTLSLSIRFLEKANECGHLMESHSNEFDKTGKSKDFVNRSKELRDAMANRVRLDRLECQKR